MQLVGNEDDVAGGSTRVFQPPLGGWESSRGDTLRYQLLLGTPAFLTGVLHLFTWTSTVYIISYLCEQTCYVSRRWQCAIIPSLKIVPFKKNVNLQTKVNSLLRMRCVFLLEEVNALENNHLLQKLVFVLAIF